MSSLVEISSVVLEKKIMNTVNVFSLFNYYLHLEKSVVGPVVLEKKLM